jgi:hypothetical protein
MEVEKRRGCGWLGGGDPLKRVQPSSEVQFEVGAENLMHWSDALATARIIRVSETCDT